jgi:hypothetical protein
MRFVAHCKQTSLQQSDLPGGGGGCAGGAVLGGGGLEPIPACPASCATNSCGWLDEWPGGACGGRGAVSGSDIHQYVDTNEPRFDSSRMWHGDT